MDGAQAPQERALRLLSLRGGRAWLAGLALAIVALSLGVAIFAGALAVWQMLDAPRGVMGGSLKPGCPDQNLAGATVADRVDRNAKFKWRLVGEPALLDHAGHH